MNKLVSFKSHLEMISLWMPTHQYSTLIYAVCIMHPVPIAITPTHYFVHIFFLNLCLHESNHTSWLLMQEESNIFLLFGLFMPPHVPTDDSIH